MSARNVLESQQSVHTTVAGRPAAGCWKLASGRALSLHPREHGVLAIAQGRMWVTLSAVKAATPAGIPADLAADLPAGLVCGAADQVLQAGDSIAIAPGQHVVMEAWSPAGAPADVVAFAWSPQAAAACQTQQRSRAEWDCSVVQPLRDLLHALGQGSRAVGLAGAQAVGAGGRLVVGIARFALFRIAAPHDRRPA